MTRATRPPPDLPSPMGQAAIDWSRRGYAVFPCKPADKQPLLGADKDANGAKIRGTGGVSKASWHEAEIATWWKRWPQAMIGVAMGRAKDGVRPLFALDFDPRHDKATGEDWTLDRLKGEVEAQIGCALPPTLSVRTPSGGVHLYFLQPPDTLDGSGEPIRNRGNLPLHVDVRGVGGYVIAPPSVMDDARRYRWLHGKLDAEIAEAPAALVAVLREKAKKDAPPPAAIAAGVNTPASAASAASPLRSRNGSGEDPGDAAVRKYALSAFDAECQALGSAPKGDRNIQINARSFALGQLVGAGALNEATVRAALQQVVAGMIASGGGDYAAGCETIENGLLAGMAKPRDLRDVAAAARARGRSPTRSIGSRSRGTPEPPPKGDIDEPFHPGRVEPVLTLSGASRERLERIAAAWLQLRLQKVAKDAQALKTLAWGIGRRVAAGLLDRHVTTEAIWPHCDDVDGLKLGDIDAAIDAGIAKGFDPGPQLLGMRCSGYPLTDFGIAERFRDRHGERFRFTTAKGWLGWDERRWKVLDQEKDVPPAEVIAAVFETVRAIQGEAALIADTGVRLQLADDGKRLDLEERNPHGLDHWVAKGKSFVLFSSMVRAWGRQSESSGKPAAIALLSRRWLTVPIEEFDVDQLAINVLNGTLRFSRAEDAEGRVIGTVVLDPHRREDLNTKFAPVVYDPAVTCPLYDGMIAWAQPEAAMRRYLHQVAGYSSTGETGEHQLWFNYGRGRNGKSTTIDAWCAALGDYSGTIGIESWLDQGIKKRGDQASPDMAKLGGVRMLRASEPERGAKLNAALIKAATGGEPMAVRALHRGFFDLHPRFKLLLSGNTKPDIPDTDDGIWGRVKLIPWPRHIDQPPPDATNWPKKDIKLGDKIKAGELSGVFNRLVAGLLDRLANGLVEPDTVKEATQAYRDDSDPLARFLRLCTEADPASRVQSSRLHEVFVAWCKAAGEKEWTQKGFSKALADKGFTKKASDGMQWLGIKLVRQASDFVDVDGKVLAQLPEYAAAPSPNASSVTSAARPPPLDDLVYDDDLP